MVSPATRSMFSYSSHLVLKPTQLNSPLEINLLGLRTNRHYPDRRLFEIAGKIGNKIVLGVDAHAPDQFHHPASEDEAMQMVKDFNLQLIDKPFI